MKILALIGSPRKRSNTDILVDRVLLGAKNAGHSCKKFYLYDADISACIDCRGCKKPDFECILEDGMARIYPKLAEADVIIFGTPVYWYGPTAKMKLVIDRMRPFIASGIMKGKTAILVAPSAEGDACCGPLIEMFQKSFDYLEIKFGGSILVEAYERGEIKNNASALAKAFALGQSLEA